MLVDCLADVRQLRDYIDAQGGPVSETGRTYKPLEMLRARERDASGFLRELGVGPKARAGLVATLGNRRTGVAADQDQAALIIDSIAGFMSRNPILSELVIQKNLVRNTATDSELRVMSADDRTSYGIRPRKVYFDELSLQPDDRLWNAMWSAIGKSRYSQMVAVSMAGFDFASVGWRVREQAAANDRYYFHTREDSTLAPWLSPEDVEEQRATLHPSDFARFWECRWQEPRGSWITKEMYDKAERGREAHRATSDARHVGFVDVGLVHDPTVVAVAHLDGERVVLDTLRTFQGSKGNPVDIEAVEEETVKLTSAFGVKHWRWESPQAVSSVQRLQNRLPVTVEARYPTANTQAELWGGLYRLFSNGLLTVYPHEQMRKEALSLHVRTVGGRMKVVESSSIHQDHVVALGGAAEMLQTEDNDERIRRSSFLAGDDDDDDFKPAAKPVWEPEPGRTIVAGLTDYDGGPVYADDPRLQ
jgi:hypothetical protein